MNQQQLNELDKEVEEICEKFRLFQSGLRMLILLTRHKDGGTGKEEQRSIKTEFTFDEISFKSALKNMLLLMHIYPGTRLYLSVNSRNMDKVIHTIEKELLELHYCNDDEQKFKTKKKLIKSPRHFVMQQSCSNEKLFIIDVDGDMKALEATMTEVEESDINVLLTYATKNGFHIVTKPFNPSLIKTAEIKKDGLLLLKF